MERVGDTSSKKKIIKGYYFTLVGMREGMCYALLGIGEGMCDALLGMRDGMCEALFDGVRLK